MNEIKKCSISGIAFHFEPDAYEELEKYLAELRSQYGANPDGEEIIADIEARIAELILSTQDNARTVGLPLVRNIIAQLGSVAEIEQESSSSEEQPRSEQRPEPRIPRRLYRSAEGAKLGGVCAGLGNYFDIDPVWVRLIFVLPILCTLFFTGAWVPYWLSSSFANLFGVFTLGYVVMWFAVPTARSARQKLEMRGEKITPESISRKTSEARHDVDGRPKAVVADTVSVLGQFLMILLKIIAGFILFGLVLVACSLIVGAFALAFHSVEFPMGDIDIWVPILGIFAILIPCLLLIYVLLCLIASLRPKGKIVGFTFLGWVVIVFLLIFAALNEGLHRQVIDELLPTSTRNSLNLLNDPSAVVEEAVEEYEQAAEQIARQLEAALEESAAGALQISTPDAHMELRVDQDGVKIDVKERVE